METAPEKKEVKGGVKKLFEPKIRIIVVEDEEFLRDSICRFLRKQNIDVFGVRNGFEALLLMQYQKPHLIISDIRMPKLGGMTMAEGIRNRVETRDIPIIFITAHREEEYYNRARELKVDYILLKPFTLLELLEKIEAVLKMHDIKLNKTEAPIIENTSSDDGDYILALEPE